MAKVKIGPGAIISTLGFAGLLFTFVDSTGEIGSKIPIVLFFIIIMILGLLIQMAHPEAIDDTYGEVGSKREFS